jgi:hypothetical protein
MLDFLTFFLHLLFCRIFFLPYDDDMENCVVGSGVFFILHIFFVSFSPRKCGVSEEWQWHFRQLKHFFPFEFHRSDEFHEKNSPF